MKRALLQNAGLPFLVLMSGKKTTKQYSDTTESSYYPKCYSSLVFAISKSWSVLYCINVIYNIIHNLYSITTLANSILISYMYA